jgi:serine/threonine protein kinase
MGCGEAKYNRNSAEAPHGFHRLYRLEQKLGEGTYGSVHLAHPKAQRKGRRNSDFAVKVSDSSTNNPKCDADCKQVLRGEVEILKMLRDESHCVQLVDFYEEGDLSYIIMEKCESSLPMALVSAVDVTVPTIANCFQQMLQSLSRIHTMGIVHRDVKPANFLINGSMERHYCVKLCDFGSAAVIKPGNGNALWDVCGTLQFCAPEMLRFSGYGTRADIWSFGVIAYLFLLGQYVHMPRLLTLQKMKVAIREDCPKPTFSPFPGLSSAHVTPSMISFLRALLCRDVSERCSANKAMKLEWLRSCLRCSSMGKSHLPEFCEVSLKPMLDSARKLRAFSHDDPAVCSSPIDQKLNALQASMK